MKHVYVAMHRLKAEHVDDLLGARTKGALP